MATLTSTLKARDKVFQSGHQKFPKQGSPEAWAACTLLPFLLSSPLSPGKEGRGFSGLSRLREALLLPLEEECGPAVVPTLGSGLV